MNRSQSQRNIRNKYSFKLEKVFLMLHRVLILDLHDSKQIYLFLLYIFINMKPTSKINGRFRGISATSRNRLLY